MNPKIVKETPITMVELKETLKEVKKRDSELNFRAQKTEEFLNIFVKLKPEQAKEIRKKIEEIGIPRLKSEQIDKLIDMNPINADDVKSVLSGYALTVTKENMKKIADIFEEYVDKKEKKKKEEPEK